MMAKNNMIDNVSAIGRRIFSRIGLSGFPDSFCLKSLFSIASVICSPLLPLLIYSMTFGKLTETQLSEFYVVSATIEDCTLERVIMIPTAGIPEGREAEVIKNVIRTKNQFIEYVAFILGDDYVQSFLENKKSSGAYGEWDQNTAMPAVYEKMLKTSVSDPDRLGEIQYITKAIQEEEIIPPEFREMYRVFCNTLGIEQV